MLSSAEKRDAWLWLLESARWKQSVVEIGGYTVTLERGQLAISIRQMATVLGWSRSSTERFLKALKTAEMIGFLPGTPSGTPLWEKSGTPSGTPPTIVTICNYDKYQGCHEEAGTPSGTPSEDDFGTPSGTHRKKKGKKEENKGGGFAFLGRVIRLTPEDLERWQRGYPNLDIPALLQSRDDWLASQDTEAQRRWFMSTSNWLARKQAEASAPEREGREVRAGII